MKISLLLMLTLLSCSTMKDLKDKVYSDSNDSIPIDPNSACSQKQGANVIEPKSAKLNSFENDLYKISINIVKNSYWSRVGNIDTMPDYSHIITVTNKTKAPIKIIWDQSNYISTSGESEGIFIDGTKFISHDQPTPPSMIAPSSFITKSDNAKSKITYTSSWQVEHYKYDESEKFGFNLALEIDGKIKYEPIKLITCK